MVLRASLLAHLPDAKTNQVKDELDKVGNSLADNPILDGHLRTLTIAASSTATLTHKLGRVPRGWFVCDATGGPPGIYRTAWNKRTISFTNGIASNLVVQLWVF